jgi:hypothetical protein
MPVGIHGQGFRRGKHSVSQGSGLLGNGTAVGMGISQPIALLLGRQVW